VGWIHPNYERASDRISKAPDFQTPASLDS
jgi:hypothetical protein